MSGTFFEILGVLIAFVTVLLLMSMVVTGLVQATQAILRLRARNLRHGLASINRSLLNEDRKQADRDAFDIMTASCVSLMWIPGKSSLRMLLAKIFAPPVSWIEPKQLKEALEDPNTNLDLDKTQKRDYLRRFEQIEVPMSRRFQKFTRVLTIVWSFAIAVYFQMAAPDLLSKLSEDPAYRNQIADILAPQLVGELKCESGDEPGCALVTDYADVSEEALERLAEEFPDNRYIIEEASGIDPQKEDQLGELELVLADLPNKDAIMGRYADLLDELYLAQVESAAKLARQYTNQLSFIDIKPWPVGWEFYSAGWNPHWSNIFGVLMTAVLLSFGAPFWFNQLQTLINLRDGLKPSKPDQKDSKE